MSSKKRSDEKKERKDKEKDKHKEMEKERDEKRELRMEMMERPERTNRRESESSTDGSGTWMCVVCCQKVPGPCRQPFYALGPCDHCVCYECSTKMRVLCQQNECPICRQDIPKVIFTTTRKQKYADYDFSQVTLIEKQFNICFESELALNAYSKLLEYRCRICKSVYNSFKDMDIHIRKDHELFLCDLCVDNLKIFSHERKYYSRKDLARHRKTGDPDDTSHRGHPLCQFCDVRYMDEDDLHRHLRKDHYYCHFCDPLGLNQFFASYDVLRVHFKSDHYLCEEGGCREEQFTSVFRSEIDLQAHRISVHCVSKTEAKQARTLSLEFSLKPRGPGGQVAPQFSASVQHQPFRQKNQLKDRDKKAVNLGNSSEEAEAEAEAALNGKPQEVPKLEDFPTLVALPSTPTDGAKPKSGSNKVSKPKSTFSSRAGAMSTFASKIEEDFPALSSFKTTFRTSVPLASRQKNPQKGSSLSSLAATVASTSAPTPVPTKFNMISAKTSSSSQSTSVSKFNPFDPNLDCEEFPALPVNKRNKKKKNNVVNNNNKPSEETGKKCWKKDSPPSPPTQPKVTEKKEERMKLLTNETDFPGLSSISPPASRPPPGLTGLSKPGKETNKKSQPPPGYEKVNGAKKSIATSLKEISLSSVAQQVITSVNCTLGNNGSSSGHHEDENGNREPPPGSPKLTSQVKKSSYPVEAKIIDSKDSPTGEANNYVEPLDFQERNQMLVQEVGEVLRDRFSAFKRVSNGFRGGDVLGDEYYKKCLELFGKNHFQRIFLELIVLLPDIRKQNELLAAHEKYSKYSRGAIPKRGGGGGGGLGMWLIKDQVNQDILVCPNCGQVLAKKDGADHMVAH